MMRKLICVGDTLSSGGNVLPYGGPAFTIGEGHQVALIGGQAYCKACKRNGTIAKAGGSRRPQFMGEVALENDIVMCGCNTPPTLVSVVQSTASYDDQDYGTSPAQSIASTAASSTASQTYDEHFVIQDKNTGQPLSGITWCIQASGREVSGKTTSDGKTSCVCGYAPESVTLLYAVQTEMGIRL